MIQTLGGAAFALTLLSAAAVVTECTLEKPQGKITRNAEEAARGADGRISSSNVREQKNALTGPNEWGSSGRSDSELVGRL